MSCENCIKKDVCKYKEEYIQNTEHLNELVGNQERELSDTEIETEQIIVISRDCKGEVSSKELTLTDYQSVFIRCKFHLIGKHFT